MTNPLLNGPARPLKVIIVGGSLSGLIIGILLKRQGHSIHILESATSSLREGLAAGMGLSTQVKRFLDENDRLGEASLGAQNDVIQILDPNLKVKTTIPIDSRSTTWDATYYRLRANFDGMASPYCPQPPAMSPDEGLGLFDSGKRVLEVKESGSGLSVLAEDVDTHALHTFDADKVIAADGANSTIRRQLYPAIKQDAPGFLIWRGTVPTSDLSPGLLERIEGNATIYPMLNSYVIIYTIPGLAGSVADGDRHINFAWYDWPTPGLTTSVILTDTSGQTHHTTIPKGKLRPEIWAAQLARGHEMIHPELFEIQAKLQTPFVSLVTSVCTPKATAFDEKLFFIGDALVQMQPNTGEGVNHAAFEAMGLAEVFAGRMGVGAWEEEVLGVARKEMERSREFPKGMLGTGPEGVEKP